jgi:hypothetical protein
MDEIETTEADGELQIVTECWIEPQHGYSVKNSPERKHWDDMTYKEIAQTVRTLDSSTVMLLSSSDPKGHVSHCHYFVSILVCHHL